MNTALNGRIACQVIRSHRRLGMGNGRNYWTISHGDGWAVKREGSGRATSVHSTQADAWNETRRRARGEGSEAILQGKDGKIETRNTYGSDLRSQKG